MRRIGIGIMVLALLLPLSGCLNKEKYIKVDRDHFPDEVLWEAARKKDLDHDTKLSSSEIECATSIVLDGVKDLKGLDVFTGLTTINLRDVENMKYDFKCFNNLKTLTIDGTWASNSIDLSGNANLEWIKIKCKNLEELILPENAPLKEFTCIKSQLTGIDLNNYKSLKTIHLENNYLMTELNLNGLPELTELNCGANKYLSTITISDCPKLKKLDCSYNSLVDLNISGCDDLEELTCCSNHLSNLDVSAYKNLKSLDCGSNELTELDVSSCPDLTELNCINNDLEILDLRSNSKLTAVTCGDTGITGLDLSFCPDIKTVECYRCNLSELNIEGCSKLSVLVCYENELSGIDVTGCPNLYWLLCNGNGIDSLDISNCPKLTDLMQSAEAEDWTDGSIAYRDGDFRMLCFDPGTEIETG